MDSARHYLRVMRQNWKTIAVTALIACVAAVGVSLLLPRTYESEARLLVSEPNDSVSIFGSTLPELSAQKDNNVATQAELLRSRTLFAAVIRRLGLHDSPASLMRRVKIAPINQTAVISVIARADDPQTAADIANTLADEYISRFRELKHRSLETAANALEAEQSAARQDLQKLDGAAQAQGMTASQVTERQAAADRLTTVSSKLEELQVSMKVEEGWGIVADEAVSTADPIGPTPLSSGLVGLLAGALFGIVYVLFADARAHEDADHFPLEAATLLIPTVDIGAEPKKPQDKREKQLV